MQLLNFILTTFYSCMRSILNLIVFVSFILLLNIALSFNMTEKVALTIS